MKILAASLVDSIEQFLHAGYISSQPQSQWPTTELDVLTTDSYPIGQVPKLSLDVAESLRLQGEQLAAAAMNTGLTADGARWCVAALGIVGVAGYHLLRQSASLETRARRSALAAGVSAVLAVAAACTDDAAPPQQYAVTTSDATPSDTDATPSNTDATPSDTDATPSNTDATPSDTDTTPSDTDATPSNTETTPDQLSPELPPPPPPPWEGVARQAYQDPERATQVILYGLIGNALIHSTSAVKSLVDIHDKVLLPAKEPTEGEAYALKTYAFDGWGRELRLESDSGAEYNQVTSAGADGAFGTSDDVVVQIPFADRALPTSESTRMPLRSAWYVTRWEQNPYVLFSHTAPAGRTCYSSSCFVYTIPNASVAESVSGSGRFGAFGMDDLPAHDSSRIRSRYDEVARTASDTPLVLEVFGT